MITITKKQEIVLDQIKIFHFEYPDGVPIKILREEVDIHEYDLVEIIKSLAEKNLVEFEDNKAKLADFDREINTVNSKKDVEQIELNNKEKASLELIKELVDENNLISKYILEGNLLYGDLKLSNFRMYHIVLSLQNKGILKSIKKDDGEYYLLVSS